MDFQTLTRRQLQALCKKNKIRANITNVAMAHALSSLDFVEGMEEIVNVEIGKSPMVAPSGGGIGGVVGLSTLLVAPTIATGRRADSTAVRRKMEVSSNKSLDEIEDEKMDVSVKTPASRRRVVKETSTVKPVYNIRRSARLAKKIEERKKMSEAIKIDSFAEDVDEIVEVEMKESSVDQSDISEITVLDNFEKITLSEGIEVKNGDEFEVNSMEKTDITNGRDVAVTNIEQRVVSDIETDAEMKYNVNEVETILSTRDESTKASTEEHSRVAIEKEYEVNSDVEEEAKESIEEDSGMNFNVDEEAKAIEKHFEIDSDVDDETTSSTEDTETNSSADEHEETNASIGKDTEMNSYEEEEAKASIEMESGINSTVEEEAKVSIQMDSGINSSVKKEATASVEMDSGINSPVEKEEAKASIEKDTESDLNVDDETKASTEKETQMNFNVDEEAKISFEDNEMNSNEDDETKGSTEDAELNSNVNEETNVSTEKETKMNPIVDDKSKASFEVTERNSNEDNEIMASIEDIDRNSLAGEETKLPNVKDAVMNFEEDGEVVIADLKGHEESDMPENESSNDEESDMSDENETSSDDESDMSNEDETSNDDESDISDDYQEEFCAPEVGRKDDVGKDEPVNDDSLYKLGSGDDDSANGCNHGEMNIPELEIQDGDDDSEIFDENETPDDEETVLDNFKKILTLSEEIEVKNDDFEANSMEMKEGEAKASIKKETEMNSNVEEVAKASTEKETGTTLNVDDETKASTEKDTQMSFNVDEEAKESFEDNEMNSNEDDEHKGSTGDTELISNVDEETKVSTENDTETNSIVDEEAKESFEDNEMNSNEDDEHKGSTEDTELISNVDEETKVSTENDTETNSIVDDKSKASFEVTETNYNEDNETVTSIEDIDKNSLAGDETKVPNVEDTAMNFEEDGEVDVTDLKVVGLCYVENGNQFVHDEQEHEAYAGDIEKCGHEESDMPENETSNDEESDMSDENETSSDDESDMSDEDETSRDDESDMSDDYQEEFCAPTVGGKEDMGKGEPVNDDSVNVLGSCDDDSVNEFNHGERNIPELDIQDGDDESLIFDENEISDDEETYVSDENRISNDKESELVDDKAYLEPGFAGDNSALEFNQEEMVVCKDTVVPKVEIQNQDDLLNSEAKRNAATELMVVSEDIVVPKVGSQDEDQLNSEAKSESDPIHIVAPLINDDVSSIEPLKKSVIKTPLAKSADKAPRAVQRLTQILKDDKENVDSGRKPVLLKDGNAKKKPLEDSSIKELTKMLKQKWNISEQQKEDGNEDEDIKATITRPALKTLSENRMGVESRNN